MHIRDIESFAEFESIALSDGAVEWRIGGAFGGDCWGGEADREVEVEEEPEDEFLDELLTDLCPDLTFLQYRRLLKAGVYVYDKREDHEFYGNYTLYKTRRVDLRVLYETLRDFYE